MAGVFLWICPVCEKMFDARCVCDIEMHKLWHIMVDDGRIDPTKNYADDGDDDEGFDNFDPTDYGDCDSDHADGDDDSDGDR